MNGDPVGVAAGEVDAGLNTKKGGPFGYLSLAAVHPEFRGRGIGQVLAGSFFRGFTRQVSKIEVGTQIENYAANRLYQKLGLSSVSSLVTFHRWF